MSLIDPKYITDMTARINAIPDCSSLAVLEKEIETKFKLLLSQLEDQISILGVLNINVANITDVVNWVYNYIKHNILAPYNTALLLQAELVADLALLMQSIESKASSLSCVVPLNNSDITGGNLPGNNLMGG